MDKFFNAFGFGLAALLASSLALHAPTSRTEAQWVPPESTQVADPIAAQGNAAVREIEEDARNAAQSAQPANLQELAAN